MFSIYTPTSYWLRELLSDNCSHCVHLQEWFTEVRSPVTGRHTQKQGSYLRLCCTAAWRNTGFQWGSEPQLLLLQWHRRDYKLLRDKVTFLSLKNSLHLGLQKFHSLKHNPSTPRQTQVLSPHLLCTPCGHWQCPLGLRHYQEGQPRNISFRHRQPARRLRWK